MKPALGVDRSVSFRYIASQGLHFFKTNRLQCALLVLCYASGILVPLAILAYRQGFLNVTTTDVGVERDDYSIDNSVSINKPLLSDENFRKLTDYGEIEDFLAAVGNGARLSFYSIDTSETAIQLDGHIIRGSVRWCLPANESGTVYESYSFNKTHIGQLLSPDKPYELMIGEKLLRGVRDPSSLIDKEITLYGTKYTVCGILRGSSAIIGNIQSRKNVMHAQVRFRVDNNSQEVRKRLSGELKSRYSIYTLYDMQFVYDDNTYENEMNQQIRDMLIVALLGFLFCILNSFGIVNSLLADNYQKVYTKLSVGARRTQVLFEFALFWFIVMLISSSLAFGALYIVREYMALFFHYKLDLSWRMILLVPVTAATTALVISSYSVIRISRKLA